ncbi:MAG: hypothetical protein M1497_11590 [Nitrospirae bacterium]|nr:hypothetical protein [Nitrospirota bacterium]
MKRAKAFVVAAGVISLIFMVPLPGMSAVAVQGDTAFDTSVRNEMSNSLATGKGVCPVVSEMIRAGRDTLETVKNAILLGHPACVVVKCAIEGGGKLEDVITGAFRAGAASDVIVTCLVEAGVDSNLLAGVIERLGLPGLGYTPLSAGPAYTPTFAPAIGGGGGGQSSVSPFKP